MSNLKIMLMHTLANIDAQACMNAGFPVNHGVSLTGAIQRCAGTVPAILPNGGNGEKLWHLL